MAYSGKLIVRCFETVPESLKTYHGVGFRALDNTFKIGGTPLPLGELGKGMITVGVSLEFLGATCMVMIFIWDNLSYLISHPQVELWHIAVASSLAALPTCCMLNVSELAFNAFLGCVCKVLTMMVMIFTFLCNTDVIIATLSFPFQFQEIEDQKYDKYPESLPALSVAIGIFFFSFAGHPCLPEVYTSMKEPHKFERVLMLCFVIMFLIYTAMALCGYLQFGKETQVVITENLVGDSKNRGELIVSKTLIGFIVASCYFQVSPLLSVVASVQEDVWGITTSTNKRIFRTILFAAISVTAWFIKDHLGMVVAVTGSLCTTITSAICPALFYYGLNKNKIGNGEISLLIFFLCCGVSIGMFSFCNEVRGLIAGTE